MRAARCAQDRLGLGILEEQADDESDEAHRPEDYCDRGDIIAGKGGGSAQKTGADDQGDRGRSQGLFIKGSKKLIHRLAEILLNLGADGPDVHRRHTRSELRQRFTIFTGKVFRLLGRDLADLHKGRAQILQNISGSAFFVSFRCFSSAVINWTYG